MSVDVETIVLGAGVIGLAIARQLALRGKEVLLLDREASFGSQTSARNSEVIHAGIYYATGSLKARLCVDGRQRLYAHCSTHAIPHRRCGKLIVATTAGQCAALEAIASRARANGVAELVMLDAGETQALEPAIRGVQALHSPATGIIDSHAFMLSLLGEAEAHGALFAGRSPVTQVARAANGTFVVDVDGDGDGDTATRLRCRNLINAAGHGACAIAGVLHATDPYAPPEPVLAKGSYFRLAGRAPTQRLIYPIPEPGGLGVHITLDLAGQARFGPDVEWVQTPDYSVDQHRADGFYAAIRKYWPALPDGALLPDYAGIRPKIRVAGAVHDDFLIAGPRDHGIDRCVHLFGMESPGLTASLAIADRVATMFDVQRATSA